MAATENITVLFTDLVGSTELASALSPDAADELRRKHFSTLRRAIATSGGTEVKSLGDGLMVVFPAASAALVAAVAMQQAVHRDSAEGEWTLGLRVGISAGEATREHDDYFGDPVIEASRLAHRPSEARSSPPTWCERLREGEAPTRSARSGRSSSKVYPNPSKRSR